MPNEAQGDGGKPNVRKSIPKSLRFEVFKRDSFKCQYCGASAPDVMLQVDHINPVAKGGDNDITNLLTSCLSCNAGKSDKRLDDSSAVLKARNQLEDLQERREQLEMMMAWREGLRDITLQAINRLCGYWENFTPGWSVNESGRQNVKKWLRTYSLEELVHAMDIASEQYLKRDESGNITGESWEVGFSKIPGICRVNRASRDEPELLDLYYIRGIVKKRCEGYFSSAEALEWLRAGRSWGISVDELRQLALQTRSWTNFKNRMAEVITDRKASLGIDSNQTSES
jgi:HNH endonuclease